MEGFNLENFNSSKFKIFQPLLANMDVQTTPVGPELNLRWLKRLGFAAICATMDVAGFYFIFVQVYLSSMCFTGVSKADSHCLL